MLGLSLNFMSRAAVFSSKGLAKIVNLLMARVGDSITQYSNFYVSLNTRTLTRDANGLVTVAMTGHGVFGEPNINIVNCSDTSYEYFGPKITVDANSFRYQTAVTGLAGSIVGTANTAVVVQNRYAAIGYWQWFQSKCLGGARDAGNFGQGGDRADEMTAAVTKAIATGAHAITILAGTNDINGGATGAVTLGRVNALIDAVLAAGRIAIVVGVPPLGAAFATSGKNTATLFVNDALRLRHNGNTIYFVDVHPLLVDTGSTQFTTGQAWPWATTDGVHLGERAAKLLGDLMYTVIGSRLTLTSVLPTASGQLPTIPGWQAIGEYGEWDSTGGGFNGTGSSGVVATKTQVFSSNAATTVVNSLIDRGVGLGYYHNQVVVFGGAHIVTNHYLTNSGTALATLGLTTADTVMAVLEYSISNAVTGGVSMVQLAIQSNSSGAFGLAACGDTAAVASTHRNEVVDDAVLVTGPLKLNASVTGLTLKTELRGNGVNANPVTFKPGRVVLYKATA